MRTLALDLATKTGWALSGPPIVSGVWDLAPQRQRRFESYGVRWVRLGNHLTTIHELTPVSRVVIEEVRRHAGTDAAHAYGGALAIVQAWCEMQGVGLEAVPVATIKKHATGRGNSDKAAMVAAAQARGWNPADDNEADALWLLDLVLSEQGATR